MGMQRSSHGSQTLTVESYEPVAITLMGADSPLASEPFAAPLVGAGAGPRPHASVATKCECASASVLVHRPVLRSQILTDLSSDADKSILPFGWNANARTHVSCPESVRRHCPEVQSQIRIELSREALARNCPSCAAGAAASRPAALLDAGGKPPSSRMAAYEATGAQATASTMWSCPLSSTFCSADPEAPEAPAVTFDKSQTRAVLSFEQLARKRPSKLGMAARTHSSCAAIECVQKPEATCQTLMVRSREQETIRSPVAPRKRAPETEWSCP